MKVERVCVSPAYGKNGCVVGAFDLDDATSATGRGAPNQEDAVLRCAPLRLWDRRDDLELRAFRENRDTHWAEPGHRTLTA
jgi:hypothetical protein